MQRLKDHVCVVTGATRGAGRAIARVLGQEGATVFITGRSVRGESTTNGLPGTVEDVAKEVTSAGGRGIGVRCDHAEDAQVAALFDRIRLDHRRLDLLVNNAWGGYEGKGPPSQKPFWEADLDLWDRMYRSGVRAALTATRFGLPLMLPRNSGLIVSTIAWVGGPFLGTTFYDLAKVAVARLMYDVALELRRHKHEIASLALAPGFMRTERVMAAHAAHPWDLTGTESPDYLGRAVAALAADPKVMRWSGRLLEVGTLAHEYGFTDQDGSQAPPFRMPKGGVWDLYSEVPLWAIP